MALDFSMYDDLKLIFYPDPRLKKKSRVVASDEFTADLETLVSRLFELMHEHKGVGLAAPQVGVNLRVFVINPDGKPENDRAYINPQLSEPDGEDEAEEGCLSLPEIHVDVLRDTKLRMDARRPDGTEFSEIEEGFVARIWQHEFDHLNGTMLTDRMGPVAKITAKKKLRELEEEFADRKK